MIRTSATPPTTITTSVPAAGVCPLVRTCGVKPAASIAARPSAAKPLSKVVMPWSPVTTNAVSSWTPASFVAATMRPICRSMSSSAPGMRGSASPPACPIASSVSQYTVIRSGIPLVRTSWPFELTGSPRSTETASSVRRAQSPPGCVYRPSGSPNVTP